METNYINLLERIRHYQDGIRDDNPICASLLEEAYRAIKNLVAKRSSDKVDPDMFDSAIKEASDDTRRLIMAGEYKDASLASETIKNLAIAKHYVPVMQRFPDFRVPQPVILSDECAECPYRPKNLEYQQEVANHEGSAQKGL